MAMVGAVQIGRMPGVLECWHTSTKARFDTKVIEHNTKSINQLRGQRWTPSKRSKFKANKSFIISPSRSLQVVKKCWSCWLLRQLWLRIISDIQLHDDFDNFPPRVFKFTAMLVSCFTRTTTTSQRNKNTEHQYIIDAQPFMNFGFLLWHWDAQVTFYLWWTSEISPT